MINPMDLTGKLVLITGASSGIGKETAIQCSKLGAKIVIVARRETELKETLRLMEGIGHSCYPFDLSNINDIESLISNAVKELGPFNGFVHCAGIAPMRPLQMTKQKNIIDVMNVNFFSFVEIVRCLTLKGRFVEGGSIVGISSVSSIQGNKSKISYCASKSAMDSAIRCIAYELKNKKIRINSIMPGWVSSDMFMSYLNNISKNFDNDSRINRQFLGISDAIEIANTVAFLLSDSTKTITGTNIIIDGGSLQG